MAIDAKEAIEIINKGDFQVFSNEDLISLSKSLPAAGEEGVAAFAKLKDFIVTSTLQPFADAKLQPNPRDIDFYAELIAIYGRGADGNFIKGQTSGKNIQETFDIYKKYNDVNVSKEVLEENAQQLEQLEAKYDPHKNEIFSESKKVFDKLNLADDTKTDVLEAARLNAYTDSLIDGKLDEAKYVENLKSNIELAVYSMLSGTVASQANAKSDKSIDLTVKNLWEQLVNQANETKEKIDVKSTAVMGYLATTMERTDGIKDRIKTKVGNIPLLARLNKRISQLDDRWEKRYGKTYQAAKKTVKIVSNVGIGWGSMLLAGAAGPAGLAIYGAYAGYKSMRPLVQSYQQNHKEYKSFGAFLKDNKMNALTAVSGVLALGVAGVNAAEALNGSGQLSSLLRYATGTRAAVAYSTVGLKNMVDIADAHKKGEGLGKAVGKAIATAAFFAGGYYLSQNGLGSDNAHSEKSGLTLPDGKDLNEAKVVDAGNQGAAVDTTAQSVTEADSSAVSAVVEPEKDPCEDIENALRAREDSQTHQAVAEDDCNGKIEIQARDHSLHTEFWDNRNRHFLGDDLTDALYGLFEGDKPVLNLENFEGIDNKEEFVYKYAIMKANNMPEQRMLVDLIEKACGGQLTEGDYIDIARGMNSYDNHGNPLCWENTSDVVSGRLPDDVERCDPVEPVHEEVTTPVIPEPIEVEPVEVAPVEVEPVEIPVEPVPVEQVPAETVVEDTTKKFYQGYIEEHVKLGSVQSQELIKGYDYDFHDAPIPENEPAEGYDYDVDGNVGEPTPNVKSEMVTGLIDMANGGRVAYNFHDGAAVIDYTMPEDAETSKIAAHLEGFSDQPDIQARRYAAYGEVYFDLQNRLAEGETIKGAEEWMGWMDKHLAKRGLFIDENGYVAINQNADREMLLEAYQADPNGLMTDKEINEIKKSAISMAQMKNNGYSR